MMRWLAATGGLVVAMCLVSGCTRQCFVAKDAYDDAHSSMLLPTSMDRDYTLGTTPLSGPTATPATVLTPDRPPRYLSLQEAIAIALENGTASTRTLQGANGPGSGTYDTSLLSAPALTGSQNGNLANTTDYVRVLALNPAISGADIEGALAKFDAVWISTMNWTTTDNLLQGLNSFQNGESASFQTGFVKQLASGGFVSTGLQQNYQLLTSPPTTGGFTVLNPLYTTTMTFGYEQPLFRNYGIRINQLLSGTQQPITGIAVPGQLANLYGSRQTQLLQAAGLISSDGILIARLRFDQQRADFERVMQGLVLQVEVAYWNLYNSYGQLYSFEESLRIAHRAWMIAYAQLQSGKINAADYAPVRGQYEDFRTQRATALGLVLDNERNLRGILGLPVEDGCRLVPITPPTMAHFQPEWCVSLQDTLNLRPELLLARDNLRLAQYNLEVAENFMKPDIRFAANYQPIGFGTTLQGAGTLTDATGGLQPSNALRNLVSNHFNNWTIGLTATVPLGFRLESANVRAARISMAQNYYLVKDQEQKATSVLTQEYQKLQEWYKRIETTRAARKAYAEAVDVRFKKILAGAALADISFLDFQTKLATAQAAEYTAIAEYNSSLARFEWAKGTILKYDNVHIAEGPVPQCAQIRAVEHEKERSKAFVLGTRPDPLTLPGRLAHTKEIPPMETPQPLPILENPPAPLPNVNPEKIETLPRPQPAPPETHSEVKPDPTIRRTDGPALAIPVTPAGGTGAEPVFRPVAPIFSAPAASENVIPVAAWIARPVFPVQAPSLVPELHVNPAPPAMIGGPR
jgi:outer membrane protein TolC